MKPTRMEHISARIDSAVMEALNDIARRGNRTKGEVVREILSDHFSGSEGVRELSARVGSVEGEIRNLRSLMIKGFEGLLVTAGKVTAEQASQWISTRLKRES